jgi:hypothetical protein
MLVPRVQVLEAGGTDGLDTLYATCMPRIGYEEKRAECYVGQTNDVRMRLHALATHVQHHAL